MELIRTFLFKYQNTYFGIVGRKDPLIMSTTNKDHAIWHSEEEFEWVASILRSKNIPFIYEHKTHLINENAN